MTRAAASVARLALATFLLGVSASCGPGGEPQAPERPAGPAGEAVEALVAAHGGWPAFAALQDLEYDVIVEQFDSGGVLLGTTRELHRFAAEPPRRYLLRRSGNRVAEYGLLGDEAWVRIDGAPVERSEIETEALRELAVLSFLHRAPFVLLDPGWEVEVEDDLVARDGTVVWRRLAVQRTPSEPPAPRERYVLLIEPASGRLGRVLFESGQPGAGPPLRVATARDLQDVEGVGLVTGWSLAPADATGVATRIDDTVWRVDELHADNGFTDDLYRAR